MNPRPVIVWLRNDLRIASNPAIRAASTIGPVILVYVFDDQIAQPWPLGAASRWWLHHSLNDLGQQVAEQGGALILRRGSTLTCLAEIAEQINAQGLYFNRGYEPWSGDFEETLNERLRNTLSVRRFGGSALVDPDQFFNLSGKPYRVFTPFWRKLREYMECHPVSSVTGNLNWANSILAVSDALATWHLLPTEPDWSHGLQASWTPGSNGAQALLTRFLDEGISNYETDRNRPDRNGTSRLSPHLHFGEMGPRQVWHQVRMAMACGEVDEVQGWAFLREIGWREFSIHLLHHFPTLPMKNHRPQFDHFDWRDDENGLMAWQKGQTGYPIVDAGLRELWHTGWMHNRVRMIVGSFLVKHLRIHWQEGESWFWDTLVDADLPNNAASWQWIAGSGADAAPYFRIFNPMTQGEKFDPEGLYVRRWVPELADLPKKYLNRPWEAPSEVLDRAGVVLGSNYPKPIVDHATARKDALEAFQKLKQ